MVEHSSNDSCVSPSKAYDLFTRYGLTKVNMSNEGCFRDFHEFNLRLRSVFDGVASSDIEGEQEGSVLYFVRHSSSIPG